MLSVRKSAILAITKLSKISFIYIIGVIVVSIITLILLLTYNPIADGASHEYAITLAYLVIAVGVVASLLNQQHPTQPIIPVVASVSIVIASASIHFARLAHPMSWGRSEAVVAWASPSPIEGAGGSVELNIQDPGSATNTMDALNLIVPPGGGAGIDIHSPPIPTAWPWWTPRGAPSAQRLHVISWSGATTRTGPYLTLFKSSRTTLQLTESGIMITAPDVSGDVSQTTLTFPKVEDAQSHHWLVALGSNRTNLQIDKADVWSTPLPNKISPVHTIGDLSQSAEHGGTIRITQLAYEVKTRY